MNHRVPQKSAFVFSLVLTCGFNHASAEIPRVPFSGAYGGTSGAGSLAGWERLGGGNPAVLGAPGWTASASGYAPFGLDASRVLELESARDAESWGASFGWRSLSDGGGVAASLFSGRLAARIGEHWSGGGTLRVGVGDAAGNAGGNLGIADGIDGGIGVIWRPRPFASLGAAWEAGDFGIGADMGAGFGGGGAWRVVVERDFGPRSEIRFGVGLRLHPLLAVHAGLAPSRETASLGLRFGMGGWEGFSALRRHSALGGTSIQGVRWTQEQERRVPERSESLQGGSRAKGAESVDPVDSWVY